ncbi:MAG: hypothetical protein Q9160_003083 [Pyrenula sp. 1 TL-2023]
MALRGTQHRPIELDSDDDSDVVSLISDEDGPLDLLDQTNRSNQADSASRTTAKGKERAQTEQPPSPPQLPATEAARPNIRIPSPQETYMNLPPVHDLFGQGDLFDHFPFPPLVGNEGFQTNFPGRHGALHSPDMLFHRHRDMNVTLPGNQNNPVPFGRHNLIVPPHATAAGHHDVNRNLRVWNEMLPPGLLNDPHVASLQNQQGQRLNNSKSRASEVSVDETKVTKCLDRVLELFPNISHEYALGKSRKRLRRCQQDPDDQIHTQSSYIPFEAVIEDILESEEKYPEEVTKKRKRESDSLEKAESNDYTKLTGTKTSAYILDATKILAECFPYIPTRHINSTIILKQSLFQSYQLLQAQDFESRTLPTGGQKQFRRLKKPRTELEKKYTPKRRHYAIDREYNQLIEEYGAAEKHWHNESERRQRQRETEDFEAANLSQAQQDNALVECQVCFDPFPINRSISCEGEEIHFFCYGCVESFAKMQIGLMRHAMDCMSCGEPLSRDFLTDALDPKTLSKLEDLQQRQEIKDAELEGLDECPFCDFRAQCPPIEIDKIFDCENCEAVSCRLCRKESHIPLSCEEACEDSRLSRRHQVEEAMSASLMRPCPKCKIPIVKSDGCNKIICPASGCRTMICFVCKKDITTVGYNHFRGANPHNLDGDRCPLHDSDRNRNEEDVRRAEEGEISALRREFAGLDNEDLEVSRHIRA